MKKTAKRDLFPGALEMMILRIPERTAIARLRARAAHQTNFA